MDVDLLQSKLKTCVNIFTKVRDNQRLGATVLEITWLLFLRNENEKSRVRTFSYTTDYICYSNSQLLSKLEASTIL